MTRVESQPSKENLRADGLRFGIVTSEFNSSITDKLLQGALNALHSARAVEEQIEILRVPGSFEIPLAAKKLAATGRVSSIIAIGCVIRGETSHYEYICTEVARGVQLAQMDTGVPVIFCVLTCDTREQAVARSGGLSGRDEGNKGYDAGIAAVEMAILLKKLDASSRARTAQRSIRKTTQRASGKPHWRKPR
jgi:6,7-dimethyl-8-ribityllumazine synthase